MVARWQFTDHQSLFGDPVDQSGVAGRIGAVDTAGQDGGGGTARAECAPVGGAVDAVGYLASFACW